MPEIILLKIATLAFNRLAINEVVTGWSKENQELDFEYPSSRT